MVRHKLRSDNITLTSSSQGMVMVVVLWVLVLIMMMLAALHYSVSVNLLQAGHAKERLEARALAEAAIHYIVSRKQLNHPDYPVNLNGVPIKMTQWGVPVSVALRGLNGFVNPNIAELDLLAALINGVQERQGFENKIDGTTIAQNIINWRDNEGNRRRFFYAVEELKLVEGMSEEIYIALLPYLSIYAQSAKINPEYATADILKVLFGAENDGVIDEYVRQRQEAIEQGKPLPAFGLSADFIDQRGAGLFNAEVSVDLPDGEVYHAQTTILFSASRQQQIHFKGWREGE